MYTFYLFEKHLNTYLTLPREATFFMKLYTTLYNKPEKLLQIEKNLIQNR